MGTVIQMYVGVVPADAMATIDVPQDGNLMGVVWNMRIDAAGADFANALQLSFGSTSAFTSNDARQVVSNFQLAADLTTSGATLVSDNYYHPLPDIPVSMGERLYIHGQGTAIVMRAQVALHFDFDMDKTKTRRR